MSVDTLSQGWRGGQARWLRPAPPRWLSPAARPPSWQLRSALRRRLGNCRTKLLSNYDDHLTWVAQLEQRLASQVAELCFPDPAATRQQLASQVADWDNDKLVQRLASQVAEDMLATPAGEVGSNWRAKLLTI